MSNKRKILILFEGVHIAYSPTIAQLHQVLIKQFEITVLCLDPAGFNENTFPPFKIDTYKFPTTKKRYFYRLWYVLLLFFNAEAKAIEKHFRNSCYDYFFVFLKIKRLIRTQKFHKVICVDLKNLFYVNTVLKHKSCFLSLELCYAEKVIPFISIPLIDCAMFQSKIRGEYIFKDKPVKIFYVQNAPTFIDTVIKQNRGGLIYTGTAWKPFGFDYCLDYLLQYEGEQLSVLGLIKGDTLISNHKYESLLQEKRLIVYDKYVQDSEVVAFISNFEIAFCFYNFSIPWINTFNYKTAPSGKMFKYLAAGVPVICNDIIGFKFVNEFKCGVCINNFEPETIRMAIVKIRTNYDEYVNGAINAAKHFSFDKAILPFLKYIED